MDLKQREIYTIKRKRKKIRLTQIAKVIGCSQSLLSRFEMGETGLHPDKLEKYQTYIDNE
ncbi:helix-turn-helix domain-containing protein [Bacillus horti]|uniref:helix-turn-helix domain-containing protein n=1 Tax=Caldalkalibacillus horti TaxID=77523 RepID=UPI0027D7FCFD|nr:helix-turn-helix transcriptional regulator [Bacillus horti]